MTGQSAEAPNVDEIRQEARRNTRGRFEQWAKNPTCDANTLSAVHNVRLDKAAKAVGLEVSFGQSPFAIARGNRFEAGLFYRRRRRSFEPALERKKCLPEGSTGFLDLRLKINGGTRVTYDRSGTPRDRGLASAHRRRPGIGRVDRRGADDQDPQGRDPARGAAHHRRGHRDDHRRRSAARHGRRGQGVPRPWRTHRPAAARLRPRPGRRLRARHAARCRGPRAG